MLFYMTSYILKELTDKTKDYFSVSNLSLSQRNCFLLPQEDTKTVLFSLVLAAFTISLWKASSHFWGPDADLRLVLLPYSRSSPKRLTSNFGRGKLNVALVTLVMAIPPVSTENYDSLLCATSSSITLSCLINNKLFLYHIPDLSFIVKLFPTNCPFN